MAEDLDVEAMLEAPYNKSDNTSSSKHRSDKYSDKHKEKDRGSSRRRSRSRDRKRSRERGVYPSKDRDEKKDRERERDRDRDKERDRRDRDKDRSHRDKDRDKERERERDRDKRRSRDKERSRERDRSRDKSHKREKSKEEDPKEYRSKSRGLEPKLEDLPPEERDLRTVFCMQLSQRIRAKDLEEFFSSVGKVRDVRLITCNKTRRFKGIAYIEFKDAESVPLALGLTGQKLLGVPIIVQHTQAEKNRVGNTLPNLAPKTSNGPTRLYVGSLHFNITEDMLRGIFEPFGKIDHIQLMTDPETGKSKGYGFLTFHHAADAKKAMEQLNGFELAGRPMKVGHVTERTDGGSSTRFDADELDRAGVDLGATGRLQLMFKLAEGTGLQIPPAAASVLMGSGSALVAPQPQVAPPIATQCFMLNNMFDPAGETNPNWDIEIRDDVISECNKHGGVLHVYVDKASPQGNVYCKCPTIATAVASVNTLHGRWFAGRVITAAYVPLVNYHSLFPDAMTALTLLLPTRQR
ncbi:RNA-binding protein 39 isoform X1 [Galleria mellonella]|uniref:RNA-binding protein 39 isoform X1 n=1 Tax=Galleria mellonella TaxID=7137 RepID=A0ABM3MZY6_GALME|nr:RNA-binding protein 39 isoform X1 [Galleria mellonella]XP_052756880.1 RNA-binding protein 39 isoform X1 [Galleria mellonella]